MTHLTDLDDQFMDILKAEFRIRAATIFDDIFDRETERYSGGSIQIEGHIFRDMFDDSPGVAHFMTEHTQYFEVPQFAGQQDVRAYAERLFGEFKAEYARTAPGEVFDGLFNPARVVVVSRSGRIMDLYEHSLWFDNYLSKNHWLSCEEEIQDLMNSALIEQSNDNHTTARHLRETARRLFRQLDLSRNHGSLV